MSVQSINDHDYEINSQSSNSVNDFNYKRNYQSQNKFEDNNNEVQQQKQEQIRSLDIVIPEQAIYQYFQSQQLNELKQNHQIQNIELSVQEIGGLNGRIMQIQDQSRENQIKVLQYILNKIASYVQLDRNQNIFQINILISEKFVSALIGVKGKQINQIKLKSNTQIYVNKPIQNVEKRRVQIDGKLEDILEACQIIHELIDQEFQNFKINLDESTEAKFVMLKQVMKFVAGKDESFIKSIVQGYNVTIKLVLEQDQKCLDKDESIMIITGSLSNIQTATVYIMRRINDYYKEKNEQFKDQAVKLLIKNMFVSKIIGTSKQIYLVNIYVDYGKMIRELAAKSGGAQIKILSDKDEEKYTQDCVVTINGTLANKQDACCYILAQIEIFRTGMDNEEDKDGRFQHKQFKQRSRSRSESRNKQKSQFSKRNHKKNGNFHEKPKQNRSQSRSPIRFYQRSKDAHSQYQRFEKNKEFAQYDRHQNTHIKSDYKIYKNIIDNKVAHILIENNQNLLKKIERKSGSKIKLNHGQDGKYYVELKGTVEENKKAFGNLMELQMKD